MLWRRVAAMALSMALSVTLPIVSALPNPSNLRVEYLTAPKSIGISQPRFSFVVDCGDDWDASGCTRGTSIQSYRVTVATKSEPNTNVFDSGRVATDGKTSQIVYDGSGNGNVALKPNRDYVWTAEWFADAASTTGMSASSTFSTALLSNSDWQGAEWIGSKTQRQLRRTISIPSGRNVVRSRAFVSAPGCHVLSVNGKVVDDARGVCPWTTFEKTMLYQTHDLEGTLQAGDNLVDIQLGNGMWVHEGASDPAVRVLITATLDDGSTVVVRSAGASPAPAPASNNRCGTAPEHDSFSLGCAGEPGTIITEVTFASFGTPTGQCKGSTGDNSFAKDSKCDAAATQAGVEALCLNKTSCVLQPHCHEHTCLVGVGGTSFPDPCFDVTKHLAVAVKCEKGTPTGSSEDGNWTAARGPFVEDDPFTGSTTDLAVVLDPVSTQTWAPATAAPQAPTGKSASLMMPLSKELLKFKPVKATATSNGTIRFDFPENFVGVTQLDAAQLAPAFGVKAGTANFSVKHCELYNATTQSNLCHWTGQPDSYLNVPVDSDTTPPLVGTFTWHGFQYAELSVAGHEATAASVAAVKNILDAVVGIQVVTDITQTGTVSFESGHILNDIQKLVTNGQRSNVAQYMPTDCPTREKHGWLGDAQVTAEEAMLNFDMAPIYANFLNIIRDEQFPPGVKKAGDVPGVVPGKSAPKSNSFGVGPDGITDISWTAAYPLITRWMMKFYDDKTIVADHYPALVAFMDDLITHAIKGNATTGGLPDYFTWGDWCAVESRAVATPGTGPELAAFNFLLSTDAMADMATALGKSDDAAKYAKFGQGLRKVFQSRFFNPANATYGHDELLLQSLTVAPLALEERYPVMSDTERAAVLKGLKNDVEVTQKGHLTVGSVGAKHLLPQLSRHGMHATAMTVATQTTFPSFGYWLSQGATTCWENYSGEADDSHPPPPTHNHIFLCGGVGEWMYRSAAGIGPASDGYRTVFVAPQVDGGATGPKSASASLQTVRGPVSVDWATSGDAVSVKAGIAVGLSSATVTVPTSDASTVVIRELGQGAHVAPAIVWQKGAFVSGQKGVNSASVAADGSGVTFNVTSGIFNFTTASA